MQSPLQTVEAFIGNLKGADIEQVLALLAEDVVWSVAGVVNVCSVGLARGKLQVARWLRDFAANYEPVALHFATIFEHGKQVIAKGHFRHQIKSTGRIAGGDIVICFSVENGLISRYQVFEDSAILSHAFASEKPWHGYQQRINNRIYAFDDSHYGEPILFAHGLFATRESFAKQVAALSATHRCINIDLPGHGGSQVDNSSWTLDDITDDLALFIEENHLTAVNFVGLSQGAMVGLRLAAKYPKLVNKLVLIAPSAHAENEQSKAHWQQLKKAIAVSSDSELDDLLYNLQQQIFPKQWCLENPELLYEERLLMASNRRSNMLKAIDAAIIKRSDVCQQLVDISAETLVICGELDPVTPPALAQEITDGINNAQLKILTNVGHHVQVEAPDKLTALINSFL